jgi:hypothetical protein
MPGYLGMVFPLASIWWHLGAFLRVSLWLAMIRRAA